MSTHHFNVTDELAKLKQYRKLCRKKQYQQSKLDKFRAELVQLHQAGASYRDLSLWLQREKRLKIAHTTIRRYLDKLPELKKAEATHAEFS